MCSRNYSKWQPEVLARSRNYSKWQRSVSLKSLYVVSHPDIRKSLADCTHAQSRNLHKTDGCLRVVEWVHGLFLFPLVLGKMYVATCKIGSFLCSLDNLLQKNVIVLFFENQISKWRSFEKKRLFLPTFHIFLVTREKLQKFLRHISHSHTYMYFAHPIYSFCLTNFEKKYEFIRYGFSLVWVLMLILIRAILEQSMNNKMVSKV